MTRDPSPARRSRTRARRPNFRPRLEALEERFLLNAGDLDLTFGAGHTGKVLTDFSTPAAVSNQDGRAVAVQGDGKIIVAGSVPGGFNATAFALVRYNADGSLDDGGPADSTPGDSFGEQGKVTWSGGAQYAVQKADVAVRPDGKVVLAGWSFNTNLFRSSRTLVLFDPSGSYVAGSTAINPTFGSIVNYTAVAVEGDNEVVVAGVDSGKFFAQRFNADLTVDTSFGGGGVSTDVLPPAPYAPPDVSDVAIQADGGVVVAGTDGDSFTVVRYNADGSLDDGFGPYPTTLGVTPPSGVSRSTRPSMWRR